MVLSIIRAIREDGWAGNSKRRLVNKSRRERVSKLSSETCGEVKSANGWDNAADTVLELHTHNVCVCVRVCLNGF